MAQINTIKLRSLEKTKDFYIWKLKRSELLRQKGDPEKRKSIKQYSGEVFNYGYQEIYNQYLPGYC